MAEKEREKDREIPKVGGRGGERSNLSSNCGGIRVRANHGAGL